MLNFNKTLTNIVVSFEPLGPSTQSVNINLVEMKIADSEFADSVDLGEVAHHEPPHLDLHCLSSSF